MEEYWTEKRTGDYRIRVREIRSEYERNYESNRGEKEQ